MTTLDHATAIYNQLQAMGDPDAELPIKIIMDGLEAAVAEDRAISVAELDQMVAEFSPHNHWTIHGVQLAIEKIRKRGTP